MNFRKYLIFLLALCVLFSSMASNAMLFEVAMQANIQTAAVAVHASADARAPHVFMAADNHSDCHSTPDSRESGQNGAGVNAGMAHACCVNFVAPVSSLSFAHALGGAGEIIAFKSPFILVAEQGGIYRPPRQNS